MARPKYTYPGLDYFFFLVGGVGYRTTLLLVSASDHQSKYMLITKSNGIRWDFIIFCCLGWFTSLTFTDCLCKNIFTERFDSLLSGYFAFFPLLDFKRKKDSLFGFKGMQGFDCKLFWKLLLETEPKVGRVWLKNHLCCFFKNASNFNFNFFSS